MATEWLSAYTKAVEEHDPDQLEALAAEAMALIIDDIDRMESEIVYMKEAVRMLEMYVGATVRNREAVGNESDRLLHAHPL
jgi:hypothetical protein